MSESKQVIRPNIPENVTEGPIPDMDNSINTRKVLRDFQAIVDLKKEGKVVKDSDFSYVCDRFPTLYRLIKYDSNTNEEMDENMSRLRSMVNKIKNIKTNKLSYEEASRDISREYASEFAPDLLKK